MNREYSIVLNYVKDTDSGYYDEEREVEIISEQVSLIELFEKVFSGKAQGVYFRQEEIEELLDLIAKDKIVKDWFKNWFLTNMAKKLTTKDQRIKLEKRFFTHYSFSPGFPRLYEIDLDNPSYHLERMIEKDGLLLQEINPKSLSPKYYKEYQELKKKDDAKKKKQAAAYRKRKQKEKEKKLVAAKKLLEKEGKL